MTKTKLTRTNWRELIVHTATAYGAQPLTVTRVRQEAARYKEDNPRSVQAITRAEESLIGELPLD